MRAIFSIDDLGTDEIAHVLGRAIELADGAAPATGFFTAGLIFLERSLRTRVGFAVATHRLGGMHVDVLETRSSDSSISESIADTVRVVAGYSDLVVIRQPEPLERASIADLPSIVVNGGSVGKHAEHPSQALVDLSAIEADCGPIGALHVCVLGDPSMRTSTSLFAVLRRVPPAQLSVVAPLDLVDRSFTTWAAEAGVEVRSPEDIADVDVLYVAGMRHASLPIAERERFIVKKGTLGRLRTSARVYSPMPIIDEIDSPARADPRVRAVAQSDRGLHVRTALLELLLGR